MQRKIPSAITNITLNRATFTDVPTEAPLLRTFDNYNANIELKGDYNAIKEIKRNKALKSHKLVCSTRKPHNSIRIAAKGDKQKRKLFRVNLYAV